MALITCAHVLQVRKHRDHALAEHVMQPVPTGGVPPTAGAARRPHGHSSSCADTRPRETPSKGRVPKAARGPRRSERRGAARLPSTEADADKLDGRQPDDDFPA
jgi:hypothetical protein